MQIKSVKCSAALTTVHAEVDGHLPPSTGEKLDAILRRDRWIAEDATR